MGIRGLRKYISGCVRQMKIEEYRGKRVAVDTSIYLYKFKYGGNYLGSFNKQIEKLRKYEIEPIYVLDTKPNKLKKDVIDERREKLEKISERIEKLENDIRECDISNETLDKLKKQYIKVTKEDVNDLKKLFDMCGVNYLEGNEGYDAEGVCSVLSKKGVVDAVISEDIDTLCYGGVELITKFNNKNDDIEVIILSEVLEELKIEYEDFVRMCLISGCDFHKGEFKYGPSKSHKTVMKGGFKTEEYKELAKIFMEVEVECEDIFKMKKGSNKKEIKEFIAEMNKKENK